MLIALNAIGLPINPIHVSTMMGISERPRICSQAKLCVLFVSTNEWPL